MRKNIFTIAMAALLVGPTQQVYGQGWLKAIGKGLDAVDKALSTNSTASSQATGTRQGKSTKARYKVHTTAATKTIVLDGGIQYAGRFSNGLAVIGWRNGWFVINTKGEKVFDIPQGYEPKGTETFSRDYDGSASREYDSNRLMVYSKAKEHAIVYDSIGQVVKEFEDVTCASGFAGGVAVYSKVEKLPGKWLSETVWYHIDVNGNVLSKTFPVSSSGILSHRMYFPNDGLARVRDSDRWGFRNAECQWGIQPTFKKAHDFSDSLAAVKNDDGKWGYIDTTGAWVIQPIYSNEPGDFHSGRAWVQDKSGVLHFIDKSGKIVWSNTQNWEVKTGFTLNGYAIWGIIENNKWNFYLIDTSFKRRVKLPITYLDLISYSEDWFFNKGVNDRDTDKMYDWKGNLLLELEDTSSFNEGIGYNSHERYYITDKGEIIVKFEDTQF